MELFDGKAHVNACHAGLECGILGTNYPGVDMIRLWSRTSGACSPDEKSADLQCTEILEIPVGYTGEDTGKAS